MNLNPIFVGLLSLTLLAGCGQGDPQTQTEAEEDDAANVEIPDIIIPENE